MHFGATYWLHLTFTVTGYCLLIKPFDAHKNTDLFSLANIRFTDSEKDGNKRVECWAYRSLHVQETNVISDPLSLIWLTKDHKLVCRFCVCVLAVGCWDCLFIQCLDDSPENCFSLSNGKQRENLDCFWLPSRFGVFDGLAGIQAACKIYSKRILGKGAQRDFVELLENDPI